jgi:hypothetical protein
MVQLPVLRVAAQCARDQTRRRQRTGGIAMSNANPLRPDASLLVKIGSIVVHAQELLGPQGHHFDRIALQSLFDDAEVKEWIKKMDAIAMLPVKRIG